MAALAASQVNYIDLKKLNGVAVEGDLKVSSGKRFMAENGWRLQDAREVLKLLNLSKNAEVILKLLNREDWLAIMAQMPKDLLLRGLRFFSREKLLRLMWLLPMHLQIKLLIRMYGLKRLVEKMRMPELIHLLKTEQLPMPMLAYFLVRFLDKTFLKQLMTAILGHSAHGLSPQEMQPMLARMKRGQVMEGLKALPYKALHPFMTEVLMRRPELLLRMSDAFLARVYQNITQPQAINACEVLPKEVLLVMLAQLSDDWLVMVPAMADEGLLSGILLAEHSDILLALGASLLAA